jgi:putative peptidoglycan lipid II flippase
VPDDNGWSTPRIYGEAIPVPGDALSLAVATAEPDSATPWSPPVYHGPRRHRPHHRPGPAAEPLDDAPLDERTDLAPPIDAAPPDDLETAAPDLLTTSRTMAIASLASRVTGFIRSLALVAALGVAAGGVADAYNLANTLPNMVYELLLGGVLASVIIPVLINAQHNDRDRGVGYTQRLLSIATASLGGATLLAVLAAPLLASVFGGSASKQDLTALWATLLLPEIFFYGLGAMFSAVLNTRHIYGWPAWAPVLNNLITIATVGAFMLVPSPNPLTTSSITSAQILVLGIGTTLGIAAQALVLVIPLRKSGFVWKWRFRPLPHEVGRMAEFRTLTLWVLGYVAISQVGVIVVNRVANHRTGGPTTFANADLLFQVPYGILGVSLLTALMPRMSRAAARGDTDEVLEDLRLGARLSAVALVPVSVGLIVFGPEFTSVILQGRHTPLADARLVGIALAAGAFGLLPFALVMLQQRVFYAMRDARTPTLINLAMVGVKVVLLLSASALLDGNAVIIALTVSTSLSYVAGCITGHILLRRRFGTLGFTAVARTVGWITLAAAAGGAVGLAVVLGLNSVLGVGRLSGLLELVVGGALGAAVLGWLALRLPLPEVAEIVGAVRGGRKPTPDPPR